VVESLGAARPTIGEDGEMTVARRVPTDAAAPGAARGLVIFTDQTDIDQGPAKAYLDQAGLDSVSLELGSGLPVPENCREAVGAVVGYARMDRTRLGQLPHLAALATTSTGADMVDLAAADELGVEVVPLVDAATEEVAAHTVALALSAVRHLPQGAAVVARGGWTDDLEAVPPELSRMVLGVVGLGRIGRRVAGLLGPMVGRVIGCDPALAEAPNGIDLVSLGELVRQADLISLHLPLTPATARLLGPAEFAAVKSGVILVNTARGGLVDTAALVAALRDGRVGAYHADVAGGEPPVAGDPILAAPNTLVTPHMAFLSEGSLRRYELKPAENLVAALKRKGIL
jgi:D-3-phosphoglycerate dehydrogenase